MLKEPEAKTFAQGAAQVLILILMEHAQRVRLNHDTNTMEEAS